MAVNGARQKIHETVLSWPTAHPHRFGGTEFRLGKRELGHIHGDYLVDIPFPRKVRDDIIAAGRAEPHHVLPNSGWISFYLNEPDDIERAIALLQESFELAAKQRSRKHGAYKRALNLITAASQNPSDSIASTNSRMPQLTDIELLDGALSAHQFVRTPVAFVRNSLSELAGANSKTET